MSTAGTSINQIFIGRFYSWFRMGWLLWVGIALGLYCITIPSGFLFLRDSDLWGVSYQPVLDQLGISRDFFAGYFIFFDSVLVLIVSFIAILIYRSRARDWLALFAAQEMVIMGIASTSSIYRLSIAGGLISSVGNFSIAVLLLCFPNGKFVPKWTKWLMVIGTPFQLLGAWITVQTWQQGNVPEALYSIVGTLNTTILIVGVTAQVYRYRKVSSPSQKQQTKWVVLFSVAALVSFIIFFCSQALFPAIVFPSVFPQRAVYTLASLIAAFILVPMVVLGTAYLPFGIALSMIRYRLWEVDLVINRALVNAIVSIFLLFCFVLIFGLIQLLSRAILGTTSFGTEAIIAALLAGLLYNPTRQRVRNFVDRRLYRLNFNLDQLDAVLNKAQTSMTGALTGLEIIGYELLGILGKGGMGHVYWGKRDNELVAIKILPSELAEKPEFRQRFESEAEALRRLSHPNIVRLLHSGQNNDIHYIALEYIRGENLHWHLKQEEGFEIEETVIIMEQLAHALDYAHAQGLTHRDIKPANIILRPRPDQESHDAILMDFGIVRFKDARERITGEGAIGTIEYMSPEQIMSAHEVDHRADIYSLAVVCYEMLAGQAPFQGGAGQVLFAHLQQPVPDPRQLNPSLPADLVDAVLQALEKDPNDRFESAGAFAQALRFGLI